MRERNHHMKMLRPCRIPTHLGSEGVPTARVSTRFHFENQDYRDRPDSRSSGSHRPVGQQEQYPLPPM